MKHLLLILLALSVASSAQAQSLGDKLGSGLDAIGNAVERGADAVGEAVDSTQELVKDEETPEATRAKLDKMADDVLIRLLSENEAAAEAYKVSAATLPLTCVGFRSFPCRPDMAAVSPSRPRATGPTCRWALAAWAQLLALAGSSRNLS